MSFEEKTRTALAEDDKLTDECRSFFPVCPDPGERLSALAFQAAAIKALTRSLRERW